MRRGKRSASFIIVTRLPRSRLAAHTCRRPPWPRKLPTVSPSRCVCGGSDVAAGFSSTNTTTINQQLLTNKRRSSRLDQARSRPRARASPFTALVSSSRARSSGGRKIARCLLLCRVIFQLLSTIDYTLKCHIRNWECALRHNAAGILLWIQLMLLH